MRITITGVCLFVMTYAESKESDPDVVLSNRYLIPDVNEEWETAKLTCADRGGELSMLKTEAEFNKVQSLIVPKVSSVLYGIHCVWIGATDSEEEGHWKWFDGSDVLNARWTDGTFGWLTRFSFDCGLICWNRGFAINKKVKLRWEYKSCGAKWRPLCEYERPKPVVPKIVKRQNVIRKIEGLALRFGAKPGRTRKAQPITACSRVCLTALKSCVLINYRAETKQCRCYTSKNVLYNNDNVPTTGWEVWEVLK